MLLLYVSCGSSLNTIFFFLFVVKFLYAQYSQIHIYFVAEVDSSKSFEIEMIGNELLAKWEDVSASVGNIESSDSNHSDRNYNQNYSDNVTDNVTIFWCPGNSQQKECQVCSLQNCITRPCDLQICFPVLHLLDFFSVCQYFP